MNCVNKKILFARKLAKYCLNAYAYEDNDQPDTISMVLPITVDISILFSLTNNKANSIFQYKGYKNPAITIPAIEYTKRFNLYKFISCCEQLTEEYAENHAYTDSRMGVPYIGLALAHWLKAYENGYSFSNFKKAVYQNLNCAYSHNLSYIIEQKQTGCEVVINNLCVAYEGSKKHLDFYINFPNDINIGGCNIQLQHEFFHRRYSFDTLLTNFASSVPEVISYFRNKNIAKILNNL